MIASLLTGCASDRIIYGLNNLAVRGGLVVTHNVAVYKVDRRPFATTDQLVGMATRLSWNQQQPTGAEILVLC